MSGLDKIIAYIDDDAERICSEIKTSSESVCEGIINSAVKEAENIKIKSEADVQLLKEQIIARGKSAASLESDRIILCKKQEIIATALNKCCEHICNLPHNDYFHLIAKMIENMSKKDKGIIYFNDRDFNRLPDGFIDRINLSHNTALSLSVDTLDIDGGFVIKYGDIENNCSFSAIFSAKQDEFSDAVASVLF